VSGKREAPKGVVALCAEWNAADAELQALWERTADERAQAKSPRQLWWQLAQPRWDRYTEIEDELVPLLFAWAESTDPPLAREPTLFGPVVEHKELRKATGLKAHGNRLNSRYEWYLGEEELRRWPPFVSEIPDEDWPAYLDSFSDAPAAQQMKELLVEARKRAH
jgi:hypothetical protein